MRSFRTFALIAAITLGSLGGLPRPVQGAPLPLVNYSSFWRYYAGSVGLPPDWAQTNFTDATWPVGPGALGFPMDENLLGLATMQVMLPMTGSNGTPNIGYYFRTWFTFPTNALGVTLVASNLLDDGAVFYLNGAEAGRIRMPTGVVTTNTLASNGEVSTTGPSVTNLITTNLVQGQNLLAVEVHQSATTSGDVIFALSVTAAIPEKLAITEQPASQTAVIGRVVHFNVGVTGTSPFFRWFKNGAPVAWGSSPTLSVTPTQIADSADYFVVVSNVLGSVTSAVARLTVVADTFPPTLLAAFDQPGMTNTLTVMFSESLRRASATNPSNFRVTLDGSGQDLVVSNTLPFLDWVRLSVSAWQPGGRYILTVNNVQDHHTNTIAPDSRVVVGFWHEAVPMNAKWRFNSFGWDLGADWSRPDDDDRGWPEGRAPFYFDQDELPACAGSKATALSFGFNTYYFRTHFQLGETTGRGSVAVTSVVDDGAVFYLNGQEIWRVNLPSGPVSYGTWATAAANAVCLTSTNITVTNLVSGDNVLAVEVHQAQDPGFDVVFGAALTLVHQPELPSGAVLSVAREADGRLRLWWTGTSPVLQGAEAVDGPWQDVTNAAPAFVPPEGEARFFRLRRPTAGL